MEEKIVPAMIGGGLAAIAGGVIWGWIVGATGYEIGYMAWGLGIICGLAVVMFSGGEKGDPLPFIAASSSVVGIAIGKYLTFFHVAQEYFTREFGAAAASQLSVFSGEFIQFFFQNIGSWISGYDILWIGLAVFTAWRIPSTN
jgi:hypothetical protein